MFVFLKILNSSNRAELDRIVDVLEAMVGVWEAGTAWFEVSSSLSTCGSMVISGCRVNQNSTAQWALLASVALQTALCISSRVPRDNLLSDKDSQRKKRCKLQGGWI